MTTTNTKTFFIATDLDANHIVLGYGSTYEAAQKEAERSASAGNVEIGDLDINEVCFLLEDGAIEELVRVDGGKCLWSLGNLGAGELARDVRAVGLI